jgi:F0F1-type ATP synthase beta subunit
MDNLNELTNTSITPIDILKFYQWATLVIISRRGSGKTVLIKNLMHNICGNYTYNCIFVFSETAHLEKDEWSYIDKFYSTDELEDKVSKIIEYQKNELEKHVKKK